MKFVDEINMFSIWCNIFLILRLFETSDKKLVKLKVRIAFISSSGLPINVPDINTKYLKVYFFTDCF